MLIARRVLLGGRLRLQSRRAAHLYVGGGGQSVRPGPSLARAVAEDEHYMRLALDEARVARDLGEVPVGAVLVDDEGEVMARAHNTVETSTDPTAHAEMLCLRQASKRLESWRLLETTLFVTLEPCPMCAGALLQSRVKRVVWGAPNKQLGADGSWISILSSSETDTKHPYHLSVDVTRNVLREECSTLLVDFFRRRREQNQEKRGEE
ncbi:tRNA(adenine(34)) deaminase [Chloropicon roscoffensis]|uniref:tRNA(adenine(34)) deaminase n=1 Tax=Chloropicon roscoffensis TaxID=1461544 RepID=A0AAX4PID4_9CHLO